MNKGQITIPVMAVLASAGLVLGGVSSYFGFQLSMGDRVGKAESAISVLQNEDKNTSEKITDLKEDMNKRFDKLERLIQNK